MTVHPLHPVVLIIGVFFALRRMSVSLRTADQYPGVTSENFERWKAGARRAYGLGMTACFGKVLADYGLAYLFSRVLPPPPVAKAIGISLELAWAALVVVSFIHVRRSHALAREVGVDRPPEK